jgi:hypothetical protein
MGAPQMSTLPPMAMPPGGPMGGAPMGGAPRNGAIGGMPPTPGAPGMDGAPPMPGPLFGGAGGAAPPASRAFGVATRGMPPAPGSALPPPPAPTTAPPAGALDLGRGGLFHDVAGAEYDDAPSELANEIDQREERKPMPAKATASSQSPYLAKLATFARDLVTHAHDAPALRLLRQRMTEWIEDIRSVGGHDDLAAAIEKLVQRLSAALALGSDLANEVAAIAAELVTLASGAAPPKQSGRGAFWK